LKRVDGDEFYQVKEDNSFSEYKEFKAERYLLSETIPSPQEMASVPESFAEISYDKKQEDMTAVDYRKLKEEADSLSSSQHATFPVSDAAIKVTTVTGSVASVAATAVVAITIVLSSLFPFIAQCLSCLVGPDYALIEVDSDSILNGDSSFASMSAEDFYLEFDAECSPKSVTLLEGKNSYLFTGFQPDTSYTYNIICTALSGSKTTCYTDKIKTSSLSDQAGVITDSQLTYFTYEEETQSFYLDYSLYVSDMKNLYTDYHVYLCATAPSKEDTLEHVLFNETCSIKDKYLTGKSCALLLDDLYENGLSMDSDCLYFCATARQKETGNTKLLSTNEVKLSFPSSWIRPRLRIKMDEEELKTSSTNVSVDGEYSYMDGSSSFLIKISQYDEDMNLVDETTSKNISFDIENKKYSFSFDSCYGMKNYKYQIYSLDENEDTQLEYESCIHSYDEDQSFLAEYMIIDPSEAILTFEGDKVKIEVDPGFSSSKENLFYTMELVNDEEEILDTYSGRGIAQFEIPVSKLSSNIHFFYYSKGTFAGKDITYENKGTPGYVFGYPSFSLSDDVLFEDEMFGVGYSCNMPFDYESAKLKFLIDDGKDIHTKEVEGVEEDGRVLFDMFTNEPGDVNVTVKMTFRDNQATKAEHTITLLSKKYSMKYLVDVSSVIVDVPSTDGTYIPTTIKFSTERVPSSFKVNVYRNNTLSLQEEYMPEEISLMDVEYSSSNDIKVDILYKEGNIYKSYTYNIDYPSLKENGFESPTSYVTYSPDESVVTYNEDGTVNIYRKVDFVSSDSRAVFNASLYTYDSSSGSKMSTIDCIGKGNYAVLENIQNQSYYFAYYECLKVNDVLYEMNLVKDTLEDSSQILNKTTTATAKVTYSGDIASIDISLSDGNFYGSTIQVNGLTYSYDETPNKDATEATLTLPNVNSVTDIIVYASPYCQNYDSYRKDISMIGNPYLEIIPVIESKSTD
jgi:hypothetical protein